MRMKIRKAIIPVAGMGTRFLPATKAQPKEMLTLVDKPVIQYIVEEAVAAGIEQIIFITSQTKRALEDHFDTNFELETRLQEKGKTKELEEVRAVSNLANFIYIRQKEPRGDGHAILQAKEIIGQEPCAVLFGDDLVDSEVPCIKQLMDVYETQHAPVIAAYRIPKKDISQYGVMATIDKGNGIHEVTDFVEKPQPDEAPSDLAVIGKYIITPEVFTELEKEPLGKGGEIRLADAFIALLGKQPIYACEFEGTRYDCGNKMQFLIASVDYGLKHNEANKDGKFAEFIKTRAASLK
jgi:UTP--glucose-1-phosphate uridylyltransferase